MIPFSTICCFFAYTVVYVDPVIERNPSLGGFCFDHFSSCNRYPKQTRGSYPWTLMPGYIGLSGHCEKWRQKQKQKKEIAVPESKRNRRGQKQTGDDAEKGYRCSDFVNVGAHWKIAASTWLTIMPTEQKMRNFVFVGIFSLCEISPLLYTIYRRRGL